MTVLSALVFAVLSASPEERAQGACTQAFKALVGDSNDRSFGRSIAESLELIDESFAAEAAALVKVLRRNRLGFISFCKSKVKKIISPCEPSGFGTEEYRLCLQERMPDFICLNIKGPWRFLADLKAGTLNGDQTVVADFMARAADKNPSCRGKQ